MLQYDLSQSVPGMWMRLFCPSLPLPYLWLALPLPLTKNEKTTVGNFLNFCGSVACLLLHFIILRRQKPPYIGITLPTSLKLIVPNYFVFLFFIKTRVECRTVLFTLFVIAEPLMYFCVCHRTTTNKNLEITNCL